MAIKISTDKIAAFLILLQAIDLNSIKTARFRILSPADANAKHGSKALTGDDFGDIITHIMDDEKYSPDNVRFSHTLKFTTFIYSGTPTGAKATPDDAKAFVTELITKATVLVGLEGEGEANIDEVVEATPTPETPLDKVIAKAPKAPVKEATPPVEATPNLIEKNLVDLDEEPPVEEPEPTPPPVEEKVEEKPTIEDLTASQEEGLKVEGEDIDLEANPQDMSGEGEGEGEAAIIELKGNDKKVEDEKEAKSTKVTKKKVDKKKAKADKDNSVEEPIDTPNFDSPDEPVKEQNVKFSLKGLQLAEHLKTVVKGVASNAVEPQLGCFALQCTGGELIIASNDRSACIMVSMPCDYPDFDFIVEAKSFSSAVKALSGNLDFHLVNDNLLIRNAADDITLPVLNFADFPPFIPTKGTACQLIADAPTRLALHKALSYASTSKINPELCGVNINTMNKDVLQIESNDGISVFRSNIARQILCQKNVTIGTNKLKIALGIFGANRFSISIFGDVIVFKGNEYQMRVNLIPDSYPDMSEFFPQATEISISLPKTALLRSIQVLKVTADVTDKFAKMIVKGNTCTFESFNGDRTKQAHSTVTNTQSNVPEFEVGLNLNTLYRALENCEEENIKLLFANKDAEQYLVKCRNSDDRILLGTVEMAF